MVVKSESSDTCVICRVELSDACIEPCQAKLGSAKNVAFRRCHDVWWLLLCAKRSRESPFWQLDVAVIVRIYRFAIQEIVVCMRCTLIQMSCHPRHVFHRHCMERWMKRRPGLLTCPLDNEVVSIPALTEAERYVTVYGHLVDCALYEESFETRRKKRVEAALEKERRERTWTAILAEERVLCILRYYHLLRGLSFAELKQLNDGVTEVVIERLLERGAIRIVAGTGRYVAV